eukprot:scaffold7133_cov116-Cylindrotheca_fusiformis.AAC.2
MNPVKFVPFSSTADSPFWVEYCHLKLETIQLSEDAIDVQAFYSSLEARLQCLGGGKSLNANSKSTAAAAAVTDRVISRGTLLGFNTLEAFSKIDKNSLLRDRFLRSFQDTDDEAACLGSLTSFVLLTFADLKQHKAQRLPLETDALTLEQAFHRFRKSQAQLPPFFVYTKEDPTTFYPLSKDCQKYGQNLVFGFLDPSRSSTSTSSSGNEDENAPATVPPMGWPLRNLVAFLSMHLNMGGTSVAVVSLRPSRLGRMEDDELVPSASRSKGSRHSHLCLEVAVPQKDDYLFDGGKYKVVGWELNTRGKPGPRWAADLNLKLMKWRMIPSTLGCSVARTLLGWGVRDFTILDYGTVSYSNPVRQNLFTLEDCHFNNGQGKPKAQAAAEALQQIAADVKSRGVHLSIPMPGHQEPRESIQASVETLDKLIQEADAVYLLTDTRESRWLPTIMASAHNKPLINAALGLDSWLVMRHGGGVDTPNRLGCYFCNDVVAPENSTKNRTLDQQCTVTRPGLAPIASSMAVELMVSMLHHPLKHCAPAPPPDRSIAFSPTAATTEGAEQDSSPLGVMPHQIRGSLVSYTMMTPTVPNFVHCTGCSKPAIDAYLEDKVELVYQTCQSVGGSFLEELSGLADFRAKATEMIENMDAADWDVEEDDEEF